MEEQNYQTIEEESGGCMMAAEPAVAYTTKGFNSSGITYMDEEAEKIDRIPLGKFGFYTDAPEVFEQRVAEIVKVIVGTGERWRGDSVPEASRHRHISRREPHPVIWPNSRCNN